jgi:hypothetical protein
VFLDPAAGTCSYSISRLTAATDAISLAWDVLPPEVALADVIRAYPHLLPRLIYVQVVAGTLITPELVTGMLSSLCDAAVTDVVEMIFFFWKSVSLPTPQRRRPALARRPPQGP